MYGIGLCLGDFIQKISMPISPWKKEKKAILHFGLRYAANPRQLQNQHLGRRMLDFWHETRSPQILAAGLTVIQFCSFSSVFGRNKLLGAQTLLDITELPEIENEELRTEKATKAPVRGWGWRLRGGLVVLRDLTYFNDFLCKNKTNGQN